MDNVPVFANVQDECGYWKERANFYHKEWADVRHEYEEYVEQSRQMEEEMDTTLEQKESVIKDLREKLNYLDKENESLKLKVESHSIELASAEKQLDDVITERDSMKEYLRQLEQKNDDLERASRQLNESIMDFERMLDKAYEKNALLEMEVDEKEMLQEKLQRLMDETRDLKQELNVKSRYPTNCSSPNLSIISNASACMATNGVICNGTGKDNTLNADTDANSITTIKNKNAYNQHYSFKTPENLCNGNSMNPSTKAHALNIVADMLRKLNLDKALLCHNCRKFRCICKRNTTTLVSSAAYARSESADSNDNDNHNDNDNDNYETPPVCCLREIQNRSKPAPLENGVSALTALTANDDMHLEHKGEGKGRHKRHSSSNSNSNSNIFKRFAEFRRSSINSNSNSHSHSHSNKTPE